MEIEKNLIYNELGRLIFEYIINEDIDFEKIADNLSNKILLFIKDIISSENLSDFEKVDNIVLLLNKYGIDTGNCHDF